VGWEGLEIAKEVRKGTNVAWSWCSIRLWNSIQLRKAQFQALDKENCSSHFWSYSFP